MHDGNAMSKKFTPHDDKGREQWPVAAVLVCSQCQRRHTVRTVGPQQLKRTAARAGWAWRGWIDGRQAHMMMCRSCATKLQGWPE